MNIQRNNVYNIRRQAIEKAKKNLKEGAKRKWIIKRICTNNYKSS